MARTVVGPWAGESPAAVRCAPAPVSSDQVQALVTREGRMARFVAGSRFGRLPAIGGLIAVGWLLGVVLGLVGATPAAAEAHIPAGHVATGEAGKSIKTVRVAEAGGGIEATLAAAAHDSVSTTPHVASGSASADGFPTVSDAASADAGAMAGRTVDGLTSQSKPAHPAPTTADHSAGAGGFAPRGGGSSGLGLGDVTRSVFDPWLVVVPAFGASTPAPVVRTAADDPSFSPD